MLAYSIWFLVTSDVHPRYYLLIIFAVFQDVPVAPFVQLLFSMPLVESESRTTLNAPLWHCLRIVAPAISLLVIYPLVTQNTLPRYRLCNYYSISCCFLNRYDLRLLKTCAPNTAFTTMVSLVTILILVGGLLIILCGYPR